MRKISLTVFFFLCIISLYAQENKQIDSLVLALDKPKADKARIYNRLALAYQAVDVKKSTQYTTLAYQFAKKRNDKIEICQYYNIMAANSWSIGNIEKSIKYSIIAGRIAKENDNYVGYMNAMQTKARCYFPDQFSKAKPILLDALEYGKNAKPARNITQCRANLQTALSYVYLMENELPTALHTLQKAIVEARKIDDHNSISRCYFTMSSISIQTGNPEDALKYARLAEHTYSNSKDKYPRNIATISVGIGRALIELKQYQNAIDKFESTLPLWKQLGDLIMVAQTLADIGEAYYQLRQYDKSIDSCLEALKYSQDDGKLCFDLYYILGKANYGIQNYAESRLYFSKAISQGDSLSKEVQLADAYQEAAKTESALNNHKLAYEYHRKGSQLEKEQLITEKDERVNELQAKFELTDKSLQLKDLTIKDQKNKLEIATQRTTIYGVAGGLALIGVISIMLWRANKSNKKNNRILKGKNEIIKSSLAEKELLIKEIHHRVKNNLQLVITLLSYQSSKFKNKELNDFLETGTGRIVSMALIHENLYQTDNLGSIRFKEYAESLIDNIVKSMADKEHVEFSMDIDDVSFDVRKAIPLGLILNELVVNTIKHNYKSGNKLHFSIDLKEEDSQYHLTYTDPQSTMTPDDTKKSSFGLELIHLLAAQLKGKSRLSFNHGLTATIAF